MDSQENTLKQEITEQTVTSADSTDNKITDTDVATSEQPVKEEVQHKVYNNKKEVVERLKEIAHSDETPQKEETDYLKTVF